jgi:hypothetical protein
MADRYWVGGSGTWDASDTSHWSASSGGSSGASVPTASDAVIFDANSFSGGPCVVTISGTRATASVDMSAATAYGLTWQGASATGHAVTMGTSQTFTDVANFILIDCRISPASPKSSKPTVVVNGDWSQGTAYVSAYLVALTVTHNSATPIGTVYSDYGVVLTKDLACGSIWGGTAGGLSGAGHDLTVTESLAGSFYGGGAVTLIADGNDAELDAQFSPAGSQSGTRLVLESTGANVITVSGGAAEAGTLEIVAGTTLQFEASAEITIADAVADSDGASTLEAVSGSWTFATAGVSVAVEGWTVSDSTAVDDDASGATFTVTDGTDGGGNTGWTFIGGGGIAASRRMVNT